MVQASGRYKACGSGAMEKPCDMASRGAPGHHRHFFSLSSLKGGEGRGEEADYSSSNPLAPAFSPLGRGEGVGGSVKLRRPVFASIAPEVLFKLDACLNRRHARW